MTSTTSTTSPNSLYFTRRTKRYERLGDTLTVHTEGATIVIMLGDVPGTTTVGITAEAGVTVTKTIRKAAAPAAPKAATPAAPKADTPKAAAPAARGTSQRARNGARRTDVKATVAARNVKAGR